MKKITLLLLMLVSYSGFAQFPLPYCGPMTFTSNVEPITLVNFAGINNSSSATVGANNGTTIIAHEDYTSIIGNVTAGSSYAITLKGNTDGNYTTYLRVYIDWNQNNVFTDIGESYDIGTIANSTGVDAIQLVGNIQVPPTALTGNTRMRVIKRFNAYGISCQTGTGYGQAEDYTLTVAPLPPDLPDYANLQFPYTATINQGQSVTVYGQVYEGGLTDVAPNITGQAPGIQAWVGYSTTDTNPNTWTNWVAATWNSGYVGNNDEYQANIGSNLTPGTYYYATRFQLNGGAYVYGATNFGFWNGTDKINGVLTVNPPLPPANDECSGAISLTVNPNFSCGTVTAGTVLGATASTQDATACGGTEDDDVWFSFIATATTHRISILNATGSTTDMYHSLWTGTDCNSLTLVAGSCSDPDVSNPTGLVVGQTYYVRVYTWSATPAQTTTFNICIGTPPPPPANDECSGAISVPVNSNTTCTSFVSGTLQSATQSAVDTNACAGTEDDDVWFSFVATSTTHTINLNNVAGSTTDLYHSLWTGTDCNNLTLVPNTCSDPNNSTPTGLTIGQTYYLRVYSWTATTGQNSTFDVCIGTPPPPPANDLCDNAILLSCGSSLTSQSTEGAFGGSATSCIGTIGNDIWYKFFGDGQTITITANATVQEPQVEVYESTDGSCTSFTAGTCLASAGTGATNVSVNFNSVLGKTYYIHIGNWINGDPGVVFDLTLTCSLSSTSFDNENFSYYPNPVKNNLNLSYDQEISNVEIFNLMGQKVSSNTINANQAQVDMSYLASGAYLVKVTSNNQVKTIRVIKE